MKIKITTRPYEVTDQAGIKTEKLYMAKISVEDAGNDFDTILAYHINTKNYFLLKEDADHENLGSSFAFTEDRDDEIESEFLQINNRDVSTGKSSTNWMHVKIEN